MNEYTNAIEIKDLTKKYRREKHEVRGSGELAPWRIPKGAGVRSGTGGSPGEKEESK